MSGLNPLNINIHQALLKQTWRIFVSTILKVIV